MAEVLVGAIDQVVSQIHNFPARFFNKFKFISPGHVLVPLPGVRPQRRDQGHRAGAEGVRVELPQGGLGGAGPQGAHLNREGREL